MATTRSRPRGRESARQNTGGVVADHATKIYGTAIAGIVIILAFLAFTHPGHIVDAATQHFMLFYAGVLALIALCAATGLGFIATDRMVLSPGHRVFVQAMHRAASFGALVFLVVHIVTEILAQRSHVIDAVVPFLSPFRPFYIGIGTISSDLVVLLVITSIMRKRFISNHKGVWRWRAIHYTAYVAFVLGVWHGLLGGRAGKPYVDWSYGFVVAFVAVGLAVRILANSLRPKENLSGPPVAEAATSASSPLRAASMVAQLGAVRSAMTTGSMTALGPASGPIRVMGASGPMPAVTALAAPVPDSADGRQPVYEPGYEGPPRYAGAPSRAAATGSMPTVGSGPMPRAAATGSMPRVAATSAMPQPGSRPMAGPSTGSMPRAGTGPMRSPMTGPLPKSEGPVPGGRPGPGRAPTGSMPRPATGPMPRAGTGPTPMVPGPQTGPMRSPMPPPNTGQMPRVPSGPMPVQPMPGPGGRAPRGATGAMPAAGAMPRGGTGPVPQGGGMPYDGRPHAEQPGQGWDGGGVWDREPGWGADPGWDHSGGHGPGGGYSPEAYSSGGYAPADGGYNSGGYNSGGYNSGGYATGGYGADGYGGAPTGGSRQGYPAPEGYPEPDAPGYQYGYDNAHGGNPYGDDRR